MSSSTYHFRSVRLALLMLAAVSLAEYGTPGTEELYEPVLKYLTDYDAFLLENHGAVTIGADVMNAYHKMETLEHFAHIALTAIQLGRLKALGKEDVQKLLNLRERFGIRTTVSCEVCGDSHTPACPVSPKPTKPEDLSRKIAESVKRHAGSLPSNIDQEKLIETVTAAIVKRLKQ